MSVLTHPLLGHGDHGFADAPDRVRALRPRQVHGVRVVEVTSGTASPGEADAVHTARPGLVVGVVTADCAPILVRSSAGRVLAIHAGWRGLAAGVVEAGLDALRTAEPEARLAAVVGPCAGPCCYEVDAPVLTALAERYGADLEASLRPSRPEHALLDLGGLVARALGAAGVDEVGITGTSGSCTICDTRFESFRRDGAEAGRMLHWIAPRA